jgi:hypothetical protein
VGDSSSIARSGGAVPSTACMVPQPFATSGNWLYMEFWAVTGNPWYMVYKTLTVAPKPSVERVARAGHSMGGRIGTHMTLWVPPWDSEV